MDYSVAHSCTCHSSRKQHDATGQQGTLTPLENLCNTKKQTHAVTIAWQPEVLSAEWQAAGRQWARTMCHAGRKYAEGRKYAPWGWCHEWPPLLGARGPAGRPTRPPHTACTSAGPSRTSRMSASPDCLAAAAAAPASPRITQYPPQFH